MSAPDPLQVKIDRSKPLEVPGAPPTVCPLCGFRFSSVMRPPRRWQKKAKLLVVLGLGLTVLWALLLWVAFIVVTSQFDYVLIPMYKYAGALAVIVVGLPAYLMGVWAMRLPRVVKLSCRQCDWNDTFLVDKRGQTVSPKGLSPLDSA